MILSQSRKTGWWTEVRWDAANGRPALLRRYDPRTGFPRVARLENTHDPKNCEGRGCAIHNHPSDHPLKNAPLNWREDAGKLERLCEHGVGHDDYDAVEYQRLSFPSKYVGLHGCDGCCHE